ncbi:hypothetical protein AVEN_77941-1 [Araneus ventricosus]|uniref:Uncharacterized protein n=1 Tax=Araneus ventricosus TaxID=182803 RepID=A0A4Y2DWP5_ARAVE|nr:hypothetical protein AVEN_77941-1 [Araneus ventricosus]
MKGCLSKEKKKSRVGWRLIEEIHGVERVIFFNLCKSFKNESSFKEVLQMQANLALKIMARNVIREDSFTRKAECSVFCLIIPDFVHLIMESEFVKDKISGSEYDGVPINNFTADLTQE